MCVRVVSFMGLCQRQTLHALERKKQLRKKHACTKQQKLIRIDENQSELCKFILEVTLVNPGGIPSNISSFLDVWPPWRQPPDVAHCVSFWYI